MALESLLQWLDYFGVAVFAVSGALVAARKGMDWMGFALIGTFTGMGGGTLRDILLDRPVYWLEAWHYILICVTAALLTFYAAAHVRRRLGWLLWADAIGLAAFTVIGVEVALATGMSPFIAVVMGVITATFGGLIRDVLAGDMPLLLHREIYASAALVGGTVQVGLASDWPTLAVLSAFVTTLSIRGLGIVFHWHLPSFAGSK
ncbi:MAG: trimeric intracellular cation channel family protein [Halothiobacillaceae bacterium]